MKQNSSLNDENLELDQDLLSEEINKLRMSEQFKKRQIKILPSYSTKAEIKGLEENQIYVIEVN